MKRYKVTLGPVTGLVFVEGERYAAEGNKVTFFTDDPDRYRGMSELLQLVDTQEAEEAQEAEEEAEVPEVEETEVPEVEETEEEVEVPEVEETEGEQVSVEVVDELEAKTNKELAAQAIEMGNDAKDVKYLKKKELIELIRRDA